MEAILKAIQEAMALASALQTLVPQIEADYAEVKDALSSNDDARLQAMIAQLHSDTTANTAILDGMRDKVSPPAKAPKNA
jgi:hypothetical protein